MLLSHVFSESHATMNLVPLGKVFPVLLRYFLYFLGKLLPMYIGKVLRVSLYKVLPVPFTYFPG